MAGTFQRGLSGLSRNTFLLAASSLFADISTEMLYPVLPVFLTQTLKASGTIVGLLDGFAQATQNIVQGFSGALSDLGVVDLLQTLESGKKTGVITLESDGRRGDIFVRQGRVIDNDQSASMEKKKVEGYF